MTPEMLTAILGAGGLAAIIPKVIDGITAWWSGRAKAEKSENQSLIQRLEDTERRAALEATYRRDLEEYAGALRLALVHAGIAAEMLPPWPQKARLKNERAGDTP